MKDIYSIDCSESCWTITDEPDEYKKYKHNELNLYFKLRFNFKDAKIIEFEIWEGDRFLGADIHYGGTELAFQQWLAGFLYKRQFVTWLSEKKIQLN